MGFTDRFSDMIEKHSECLLDQKRFTSFIRDYFPDESLMATVMIHLYSEGIIEDIKGNQVLDSIIMQRCLNRLISSQGTDKTIGTEAIKIWFYAYGERVLGKEIDISSFAMETESDQFNESIYDDFQNELLPVKGERVHDLDQFIDKENHVLRLNTSSRNNGINVIPENAFLYDTDIVEAEISGITDIGNGAFCYCSNLTHVYGMKIKRIGRYAFCGCDHLEFFTYSLVYLESIGDYAFCGSGLHNFEINFDVKKMGKGVFKNCRELYMVSWFNDHISAVGEETFCGCVGLAEEILPENIKRIERKAYYGCKELAYIDIPKSIEYIADDAFDGANPDMIVYCTANSVAEIYAKKHNMKYEIKT